MLLVTGLLVAAGFGAGLLGAMLGIGGGVFLIPLLALAFGLPMHIAIATSLVAVIATSCAGASSYLNAGLTNLRLAALLLTTTCVGAVTGGLLAARFSDAVLAALFGAVLLYAAFSMFRSTGAPRAPEEVMPANSTAQADSQLSRFAQECFDRLSCTYRDQVMRCDVTYRPRRLAGGLGLSLGAGAMSGLLGIGGGVAQVPIMHLAMCLPVRAAAGTSNYMVGVTAVASAFIYYGNGFVDPSVAVPTVLGVFFGARLGARVAQRVQSALLSRMLAVVLLYVAIQMLLLAVDLRLA